MIGWYVHHVGAGHLTRLEAVARHLTTPVAGLSSLPRPTGWAGDWVQLDRDDLAEAADDPTAGGTLHWAPLHDPGLRGRSAAVAHWVSRRQPTLVVVDVSVEVALLVRLMGVPVVLSAMPGDRSDRAHSTALDLADHLLGPWPAGTHDSGWSAARRGKLWAVGGMSRFDDLTPSEVVQPGSVAVMWGRGGRSTSDSEVGHAQAATPGWRWETVDPASGADDVWRSLCRADVVVTHAGQNAVAEVAASGRPAVVVAQARPHDEQVATALALERAAIAAGLTEWPAPGAWPGLLARAKQRSGRWELWRGGGAAEAARLVDERVQQLAGRPVPTATR